VSVLRVLVIDNYDSFTYNLVQYLGEISRGDVLVFRNDAITIDGIRREHPTHVVVSPGPCTPNEAGISLQVVSELAGEFPILGVCLGHQSIGQAFGARVTRGDVPVHGKTSEVFHDGRTIFAGLPHPFTATRYHSLVVRDLPDVLELSAWTEDGVVMGIRHRQYVVEDLLRNFLQIREARRPD
jgi:para-aminobenzoate synthetase component 2